MPLKKNTVCPLLVRGAGGTVQLVLNRDTGCPLLFSHEP